MCVERARVMLFRGEKLLPALVFAVACMGSRSPNNRPLSQSTPGRQGVLEAASVYPSRTLCEFRQLNPDAEGEAKQGTITGIVSASSGTFASCMDAGFSMQDDSGCGIYVSLSDSSATPVSEGCPVEVQADRGTLAMMVVANNTHVVEDSACDRLQPVAPLSLNTGDVGDANEGLLVTVEGNVSRALIDDLPWGYKSHIDDGSGELQIFASIVDGEAVFDVQKAVVGCHMKATGLSARYYGFLEVLPRRAADVQITCDVEVLTAGAAPKQAQLRQQ